MKQNGLLSISEMAKFSRVSRTALIFYDEKGLISPGLRKENGYRYYTFDQVATVNVINTLKELGTPLRTIVKLVKNRTPESMVGLLSEQGRQIDMRIEELNRAKTLLNFLKGSMETAVNEISGGTDKITLHEAEAVPIFLGPKNDYSGGKGVNEALHDFYVFCKKTNPAISLNYSAWGLYPKERIQRGDWVFPENYYFVMPADTNGVKPAGLYVTGYDRGNYGETDALYRRITAYIESNGLEVAGPAFEEYPLNEISVTDPSRYLIRVSVNVRKIR